MEEKPINSEEEIVVLKNDIVALKNEIARYNGDYDNAVRDGDKQMQISLLNVITERGKYLNILEEKLRQLTIQTQFLRPPQVLDYNEITKAMKPMIDEALKPLSNSLNIILSDMLCPWENIRSNSSSVADSAAPPAHDLRKYYGIDGSTCMVLGKLPARNYVANVQRAHIWPKHTYGKGLEILQLDHDSIYSPRNYLLLQNEIEYHFDRMHIMFLPCSTLVPNTLSLRVVVLEQPLLSNDLVLQSQNKAHSYSIPWSSLNNYIFYHQFVGDKKPFVRLIAQHAFCALRRAQKLGYVNDDAFPSLGNETINLARKSLEDEQIQALIERNKLSSLLVPIESIEAEEGNNKDDSEEH